MATIKSPASKNKPKTELEDIYQSIDKSINKITKDNLSTLSVPDLTTEYSRIEGSMIQARYLQCKIIREIRRRFGNNNNAFAQFFKDDGVPALMRELSPDTRTRMIQVADFFDNRPIEGISWTAAILLSKPKYANSGISEQIYNDIYGSNTPVDKVTNRLEELYHQKKITDTSTIEGEYKVINNEKAVAESAPTESSQAIITDDEKNDESSPEVIPAKLENIEALEEAILKLCEPFSVMDILSLLRKLIRKFQPNQLG